MKWIGTALPWLMLIASVAAHSSWAWVWVGVIGVREIIRFIESWYAVKERKNQ